jgi:hypothetical protein
MKCVARYTLPLLVLLVATAVAVAQTQSSSSSSAGVQVNPSKVQQKASMPPPSSATKASSIGQKVSTTTPASSDSWAEQLDVDGNGTAEQTNLVWDGQDKVLYSNSTGTFTCKNGATGSGELLIAVNGAGNKWGRPAGSGFWLASMDKAACGVQADALWGCKFDTSGTATACGVATLDQKNDDLIIATATR